MDEIAVDVLTQKLVARVDPLCSLGFLLLGQTRLTYLCAETAREEILLSGDRSVDRWTFGTILLLMTHCIF